MNIVITNVGRRGYLVDFIKSKRDFSGKVYVTDCDYTASGLYGNNDGYFILSKPVDNETVYIEQLMNLCKRKDINLVIPVIDPEIYILSQQKELFRKNNITILVSDKDVLEICYNKLLMNDFLQTNHFHVPLTYNNMNDFLNDQSKQMIDYPVFIKPIYGSGSIDSYIIHNEEELRVNFKNDMIIQEFLEGKEYGVDTFVCNGNPVRLVIKQKISMRSGETDKAITVKEEAIKNEMMRLAKKLKPYGPMDCDIIKSNNRIYIIDINPRFGGGYPSTHMAGVDFIDLSIKLSQGIKIEPIFDNYAVGQLTMKDIGIKTVNINNKGVI